MMPVKLIWQKKIFRVNFFSLIIKTEEDVYNCVSFSQEK